MRGADRMDTSALTMAHQVARSAGIVDPALAPERTRQHDGAERKPAAARSVPPPAPPGRPTRAPTTATERNG